MVYFIIFTEQKVKAPNVDEWQSREDTKKPQLLNVEMIPQVVNTSFMGAALAFGVTVYWPFDKKMLIAPKKHVFRGPIK